jgi:hypothetical protein
MSLESARQTLYDEAVAFAYGDRNDRARQQKLCEAAKQYHREFIERTAKPEGSEPPTDELTVPYGKQQGKKLSECKASDLKWLLGTVLENIENPDKAKWREKNEALADAIERTLESK